MRTSTHPFLNEGLTVEEVEAGMRGLFKAVSTKQKIIAVDFDGVINSYKRGFVSHQDFDPPTHGVSEAMRRLKEDGWTIVINTCRPAEANGPIDEYCTENGIIFDFINDSPGDQGFETSPSKIYADVYLDDKAIRFDGNWKDALAKIEGCVEWHKGDEYIPQTDPNGHTIATSNGKVVYEGFTTDGRPETETMSGEAGDHMRQFDRAMSEVRRTKVDGVKRYGAGSWNSLGMHGIFVDLNRKFQRLKKWFWDEEPEPSSEKVRDTLLDNVVYAAHALMEYDRTRDDAEPLEPDEEVCSECGRVSDLD